MSSQNKNKAYALCVNNDGYEAALELRKLYKVVTPEKNDPADWLRVVDESGEDYLYSGERFVLLTLPHDVEEIVEETFSS
jgi:alpha-L-fucosidase